MIGGGGGGDGDGLRRRRRRRRRRRQHHLFVFFFGTTPVHTTPVCLSICLSVPCVVRLATPSPSLPAVPSLLSHALPARLRHALRHFLVFRHFLKKGKCRLQPCVRLPACCVPITGARASRGIGGPGSWCLQSPESPSSPPGRRRGSPNVTGRLSGTQPCLGHQTMAIAHAAGLFPAGWL